MIEELDKRLKDNGPVDEADKDTEQRLRDLSELMKRQEALIRQIDCHQT